MANETDKTKPDAATAVAAVPAVVAKDPAVDPAAVFPAKPEEPARPTNDELVEHAGRIADLVNIGHALTVGLASRWDAGMTETELAFIKPQIAKALHERLDGILKALGFDASKVEEHE